MKKITLIILTITLMMVTSTLGAEIVSNTLTISVNNNSITIFNPYRPTDNNTFIFSTDIITISNCTNSTNCTNTTYINPQNFTFTDLFINNGTYKVLDIDLNSKLLDCISLNSQLNTSLLNCQLNTAQLGNITAQLNICQLDRRDRDNTIKNLQADKDSLTLKTTGNQNNGIIWGLGGAILTAFGFIVYIRTRKGEGVASRINKEFSPLQAT